MEKAEFAYLTTWKYRKPRDNWLFIVYTIVYYKRVQCGLIYFYLNNSHAKKGQSIACLMHLSSSHHHACLKNDMYWSFYFHCKRPQRIFFYTNFWRDKLLQFEMRNVTSRFCLGLKRGLFQNDLTPRTRDIWDFS